MQTETNTRTTFRLLGLLCGLATTALCRAEPIQETPIYTPERASSVAWQAFLDQDYHAALETLRETASTEDKDHSLLLAFCYDLGLGVERDPDRAAHWYEKAHRQGQALAILAQIEAASSQQSADSTLKLQAHAYFKTKLLPHAETIQIAGFAIGNPTARARNIQKAIAYNRQQALAQHDPAAYANVASLLEDPANKLVANAFKLSQAYRSQAFERNAASMIHLQAMRLRYGMGVAQNKTQAIQRFRQAAAEDYLPSALALGNLLVRSDNPDEVAEGLALLERTAQEDADELQDLAEIHEDGENTPKNPNKAKAINHAAALIGHPHAANTTAHYFNKSAATQSEKAQVDRFYQLAASRGSYWGAYNHGSRTLGKAKDETKAEIAIAWLEHAAWLENDDAAAELISLYSKGDTFAPQDSQQADYWTDWSIAHENNQHIKTRLRTLWTQRPNKREQDLRILDLAKQSLALGDPQSLFYLLSLKLDPRSPAHDPQHAWDIIEKSNQVPASITQFLYVELIRSDAPEPVAWRLLQRAELPAHQKAIHCLAYPNRQSDKTLSELQQIAAKRHLGLASSKIENAASIQDAYAYLAESAIQASSDLEELASLGIPGRPLVAGFTYESSRDALALLSFQKEVRLQFQIDPQGQATEIEILDSTHPYATELALAALKHMRWQEADTQSPLVRLPFNFSSF